MDAFTDLLLKAAAKRDRAIKKARVEYRALVKQINGLRNTLGTQPTVVCVTKPRAGSKPIIELIADTMPKDRPFTFSDVLRALAEAQPGRRFNESSVRTILPKLEIQGMIRRIRKNQRGRVEWVVAGCEIPESPFGAMPLTEVAEHFLKECGPLTPTELVVKMREAGYRADANPRKLRESLRNSVNRNPGRFQVGEDGRWSAGLT